jgi:hypothetical protein
VLASDDFEGRGVATAAEEKTVDYIVNACRAMKLEPGNPDGTYIQKVALWGITADGGDVAIKAGDAAFPLAAEGGISVRLAESLGRNTASRSEVVVAGGAVEVEAARHSIPNGITGGKPLDLLIARQFNL